MSTLLGGIFLVLVVGSMLSVLGEFEIPYFADRKRAARHRGERG